MASRAAGSSNRGRLPCPRARTTAAPPQAADRACVATPEAHAHCARRHRRAAASGWGAMIRLHAPGAFWLRGAAAACCRPEPSRPRRGAGSDTPTTGSARRDARPSAAVVRVLRHVLVSQVRAKHAHGRVQVRARVGRGHGAGVHVDLRGAARPAEQSVGAGVAGAGRRARARSRATRARARGELGRGRRIPRAGFGRAARVAPRRSARAAGR